MKFYLQLLVNAIPPISVCALTMLPMQHMQKFLIKHSNEQEYKPWERCFINSRSVEVK